MGINTALYNGVSGLNSFASAISVVSDNISNANTTAFKSNSIHFGDMVNSYYSIFANDQEGEGIGSTVLGFTTNFAQGSFVTSASWSDLTVSGEGFFNVVNPDSGRTYYTRDGHFYLDASGYLVNTQGHQVQGAAGGVGGALGPILVADPTACTSIYVNTNGDLVTVAADGTATTEFNLLLTSFSNKNGLVRQGGNLYISGPDVGQSFDNQTSPGIFGQIVDFTLEGSNVDMAKEMVDMIIYQASYNANSKTITTSKDLLDTAINMVR